jgi:hypothetical protein
MEIDCLQRNNTFKFKITLDRKQNLNYCIIPDPRHFSLPSTFNNSLEKAKPKFESISLYMYLLLEGGHLLRLAQGVHGNGQEDVEERVVAEHRQEDEVQ